MLHTSVSLGVCDEISEGLMNAQGLVSGTLVVLKDFTVWLKVGSHVQS